MGRPLHSGALVQGSLDLGATYLSRSTLSGYAP